MKNIRLIIDGLEEKETQKKVRKQLTGIIGVKDAYANNDELILTVNYDERTSEAEIINHLQNNGYKATIN